MLSARIRDISNRRLRNFTPAIGKRTNDGRLVTSVFIKKQHPEARKVSVFAKYFATNIALAKTKYPSLFPGINFNIKLRNDYDLYENLYRSGKMLFCAVVLVAVGQGFKVLYEFRANPSLVVPPGLTWGIEEVNMNESCGNMESKDQAVDKVLRKIKNFGTAVKQSAENIPPPRVKILVEENEYKLHRILQRLKKLRIGNLPWTRRKDKSHEDKNIPTDERELLNLVVIGDSLACGIGCVNMVKDKVKDVVPSQITRLENVSLQRSDSTGPVFPQAFARTLAQRLDKPISWRSAGVDGGDLQDIRKHCIGVLEEQARKGKIPDVVVVLCGINDLKKVLVDPFVTGLTHNFKGNLVQLIDDIHRIAPNTKIIFPGIPYRILDSSSLMKVFPLSIFVEPIIHMWELQKRYVVDSKASSIMYFDIPKIEVQKWYKMNLMDEEGSRDAGTNTLLSPDGIHPNSKCYNYYGEFMANQFCDRFR